MVSDERKTEKLWNDFSLTSHAAVLQIRLSSGASIILTLIFPNTIIQIGLHDTVISRLQIPHFMHYIRWWSNKLGFQVHRNEFHFIQDQACTERVVKCENYVENRQIILGHVCTLWLFIRPKSKNIWFLRKGSTTRENFLNYHFWRFRKRLEFRHSKNYFRRKAVQYLLRNIQSFSFIRSFNYSNYSNFGTFSLPHHNGRWVLTLRLRNFHLFANREETLRRSVLGSWYV